MQGLAALFSRTITVPTMPKTLGAGRGGGRSGYDARRRKAKQSRRWYSLKRWRKRRAEQLAREPLCRMCEAEGMTVAANTADHVEPHREDYDRFWFGDLQSLCGSHHSREKQREEVRGG